MAYAWDDPNRLPSVGDNGQSYQQFLDSQAPYTRTYQGAPTANYTSQTVGGNPTGLVPIDAITLQNQIAYQQNLLNLQTELGRAEQRLNEARFEQIQKPDAASAIKLRDAQTAYTAAQQAALQADTQLKEQRLGLDTRTQEQVELDRAVQNQMTIWKQNQNQANQAASQTGIYHAPADNPDLPFQYNAQQYGRDFKAMYGREPTQQELQDQFMWAQRRPGQVQPERPWDYNSRNSGMTPPVSGADAITQPGGLTLGEARAQVEQMSGRKWSEPEWNSWLTGRFDPQHPHVLNGNAKAGDSLAGDKWARPWDALRSRLPAAYQQQYTQNTGQEVPAYNGAGSVSTGPAWGEPGVEIDPATGWPKGYDPAELGVGGFSSDSTVEGPMLSEGKSQSPYAMTAGQLAGTEPTGYMKTMGGGETATYYKGQQGQSAYSPPSQGGTGNPSLDYRQAMLSGQSGGRSTNPALQQGSGTPEMGQARPQGVTMPWDSSQPRTGGYTVQGGGGYMRVLGSPATGNGGSSGGNTSLDYRQYGSGQGGSNGGAPNPYSGQVGYVWDPVGQKWILPNRQQDLAEWQAQRNLEFQQSQMAANPANAAAMQAYTGRAPWQQAMLSAPSQPRTGVDPQTGQMATQGGGGMTRPQGGTMPWDDSQPRTGGYTVQGGGGFMRVPGQPSATSGGQTAQRTDNPTYQGSFVPSGREFNLQQYGRLNPSQKAAFGSYQKAVGGSEEDYITEARKYAPSSGGSVGAARWR